MKYLFLLLTLSFIIQAESQVDLQGQWLRVDDTIQNPTDFKDQNFDSTIIEVVVKDTVLVGLLLRVPMNAVDYGYSEGQIKWKNFRKAGNNQYDFEGLLMQLGPSGENDIPIYIKGRMKLEDKNTILLWVVDQIDNIGGKKQKWIRLPQV